MGHAPLCHRRAAARWLRARPDPRRVILALLLFALASPAVPAAPAQPPDGGDSRVHMQVALGFADTFRPGRWTPLTVTVGNQGAPLDGTLEVITSDGDEFRRKLYPVIHQRPLQLGRDARKRFHFTVFLESVARPVTVRVRAAGREVARRDVDLRPRFGADRLALVLSRDADLDYLNARDGDGLRVLYPHPELLPHDWQGYDAVAAVVLHGLSLESLSDVQFEALRRWLARGGTLAVSGGPDYAVLRTPRLATLLPTLPTGMQRMDDAASVGRALGSPLAVSRPFHVNRVNPDETQVLRAAGDVPLVLRAHHGLGRVLYLTFDVGRHPFDRWPAMQGVWLRLLDLEHAAPAPVHGLEDTSLAPALLSSRARDFPGHGTLLVFLALYLVLLATGYRLRAGSKGYAMWMLTWAVPAVFAPAAYLLFGPFLFERGATATIVSVIEPLQRSPYARLRVDLGLHSNRRGSLRLAYAGARPVFRVPSQARGEVDDAGWRFRDGTVPQLAPAHDTLYRLHLLEGHDVVPFDLEASVDNTGQRSRLRLRNDSGRALDDAWLVYRGAAWHLGAIEAGQRLEHDLGVSPDVVADNRTEWWEVLSRHPRAAGNPAVLSQVLATRADARDERRYPGTGHALVLALTATALRPAGTGTPWRRNELALVLLRFPARLPAFDPAPDEAQDETT